MNDTIITGELDRRLSRAPDYKAESLALVALAENLNSAPATVLQRLVELTIDLTRCDSAGISLLEADGKQDVFRWVATAGAWAPFRNGTMSCEESPCGEVITQDTVLLMKQPERAFPALLQAQPSIAEGLLAPFRIDGRPVGTVWAIMHGQGGRFEAEDVRLLESLAQFAGIARRVELTLEIAETGKLESETRLQALARASSDVFYIMSADMSELRQLSGGDFILDTTSPKVAWLKDYIPPEDHARTAAAIAEAIRTKGDFELEHQVYQADGKIGWALSRAVPIRGSDGEIVEWFGTASDVTEERRAKIMLRESRERQAFLLRLSDTLRSEPSANAIANRALQMLFEEMQLDRCYIGVYHLSEDIGSFPHQVHHDHLSPLPDHVRLSDFPKALRVAFDRTLVIDDVEKMESLSATDKAGFSALGISALIAATLRKGVNHPLWAIVAVSTRARVWAQGEVSLVQEVAERTWAAVERARAEAVLRDSEERQAFQLQLGDALASLVDPADIQSEAARRLATQLGASWCYFNEFDDGGTRAIVRAEFQRDGLPSMVGVHDLSDEPNFLDLMCSGAVLDIPNLICAEQFSVQARSTYASLGMRAALGVPLLRNGRLAAVLLVADTRVRHWTQGDSELLRGVAERTWAAIQRARAEAALGESEDRQRALIEGVPQFVWRACDVGQWTWASPQWTRFTGQAETDSYGWGWLEPLHPDDRARAREAWAHAVERKILETDYRIHDQQGVYRWFQTRATPIRDGSGTIIEWLGTSTDVDDLRSLQERQRILVAELQHRTRNLLGVTRSIADKTMRQSATMEDFQRDFGARLDALARVQGLLSRVVDQYRVTFDELLRAELAAHGVADEDEGRVILRGADGIPLRSSMVQMLALVLHELATNAVKYGALKDRNGRLDICWRTLQADGRPGRLEIIWQEHGVMMPPDGAAATRTGQGRDLIERALPYQLDAETHYEFGPDGIRCQLIVPISGALHD
ncbi:PAS domain-containing protein [Sphingomonas montana]|uniref:PAS domain-containing protein n=1 Tax=Sphingomonas montana TaxID=1843236 RepID=UPI0013ECBC00|nr:PAS domain-containing protein [Sphingomonas montana]